jgi:hypothetical protein
MARLTSDETEVAQVIPPPIPPYTWTGAYSPLLTVPLLIFICVALFAPDDVLDVWSVARWFTNYMVTKFQWIGSHAQSTNYPQVALLIACMTIFLMIWNICIVFVQSVLNYPKLLLRQQQCRTLSWRLALGATIVGIPLFVFSTGLAFALPGDPSWANGLTTTRRAGLLLVCFGLSYGGGMVLGGIPMMFRALIDLDIKKGK